MSSEQWINNRCGFDISVSRFVVEATALVKQAIEAMSTLRTLHCARLVHLPAILEATDNGNALGLPGSPSWPRSIHDKVLNPIPETRERCATQCFIREILAQAISAIAPLTSGASVTCAL
jgi:hypothetical protein